MACYYQPSRLAGIQGSRVICWGSTGETSRHWHQARQCTLLAEYFYYCLSSGRTGGILQLLFAAWVADNFSTTKQQVADFDFTGR